MSYALQKPWILNMMSSLLLPALDGAVEAKSIEQPEEVAAQVLLTHDMCKPLIKVSDRIHSIWAKLSDDSVKTLEAERSRLSASFSSLKDFLLPSDVQICGYSLEHARIAGYEKRMLRLHLIVQELTLIGGDSCGIFGEPKCVTDEPTITRVFERVAPELLHRRLCKIQNYPLGHKCVKSFDLPLFGSRIEEENNHNIKHDTIAITHDCSSTISSSENSSTESDSESLFGGLAQNTNFQIESSSEASQETILSSTLCEEAMNEKDSQGKTTHKKFEQESHAESSTRKAERITEFIQTQARTSLDATQSENSCIIRSPLFELPANKFEDNPQMKVDRKVANESNTAMDVQIRKDSKPSKDAKGCEDLANACKETEIKDQEIIDDTIDSLLNMSTIIKTREVGRFPELAEATLEESTLRDTSVQVGTPGAYYNNAATQTCDQLTQYITRGTQSEAAPNKADIGIQCCFKSTFTASTCTQVSVSTTDAAVQVSSGPAHRESISKTEIRARLKTPLSDIRNTGNPRKKPKLNLSNDNWAASYFRV